MFIQDEVAKAYVEPKIREITLELLNIIRQTENDDLTSVMQKIVCTYTEQLVPVAVDMCKHLVETFAQVSLYDRAFRIRKLMNSSYKFTFEF